MREHASGIELLSIGNELLLGETVDTNAAWIAHALAGVGIRVALKTTVGDDIAGIRDALDAALRRTGTVVCTGGLGPTRDDMTRLSVAELYGRAIRVDEGWVEILRQRYARRGISMPEINRVQGELPEGATLLPNDRGTAPGIVIDDDTRGMTVLLPGVPGEMRALMTEQVIPLLVARLAPSARLESRVLRTAGLSEAALAERIDDIAAEVAPLTLAFLPHVSGVDLRLTAWGTFASEAETAFRSVIDRLKERLGAHIYADGDTDLAAVVGAMLTERGLTLSLAESCTGGLIAKRLSDEPGASSYLHASFVTYANDAKRDVLGVAVATLATHGAVSEQCAREMAEGARRAGLSAVGLSVTGVAGPAGGSDDKPVGTVWIAVSLGDRTEARLYRLAGDRDQIRQRAAQAALNLLRHRLLHHPGVEGNGDRDTTG
jgi:nicotinamide-nucleotide amidase